jgi:hypothetical protein
MLTNQYRDYLIAAGQNGGTAITTWYIGVYTNAHVPVATDTMTTLLADAGEITTYTGGTRKALAPDAVVNGVWSNAAASLMFEFPAGATIRGVFITSNPVIGSTTGTLMSADLLSSPKVPTAGESVKITAGMTLMVA